MRELILAETNKWLSNAIRDEVLIEKIRRLLTRNPNVPLEQQQKDLRDYVFSDEDLATDQNGSPLAGRLPTMALAESNIY